ncbi:hypothetical protein MTR_0343s0040 [Medicago truncatula]|uniref:Uncharacterized protein n=1 Tax=Medicago truncatula TaxID=3880 RepID=A0A072TGF9_MEDTR|nr:hypothetical protein MTR_0343s0040 [Medicago truncatula]
MENKKWEELDFRASSTIHMSLAKNILVNVLATLSAKELWEKLEGAFEQHESFTISFHPDFRHLENLGVDLASSE